MSASDRGSGSPLRRLDDAVVPHMQRAARRAVRAAGAPFRWVRRWEAGLAEGRPERFLWRHRQELVLAVALIAFVGSYVHLQRFPDRSAQATDQRRSVAPTPAATAGDDGPALAGGAVVVGPAQDEELGPYIDARRGALDALPAEETRVAVVSFEEYLTGEEADDLIPDGLSPLLVLMRLPDQEMEPVENEVDGSIERGVAQAVAAERERIAREEAEFQELLESGTVEDEDFVAEFREQVERLRAIRNLLDTGAGTVFAVVVEGSAGDLRQLAEDDGVRLVDPAPAETDPETSTFYGLLPDDTDTASYGGLP